MKLLFVRHGQTRMNASNSVQGQHDEPLNSRGREQARNVRSVITNIADDIAAIYASDLSRAYQTASEAFPERDVITDSRLREQDFGAAEGQSMKEFKQEHPEYKLENGGLDIQFPDGESTTSVYERVTHSVQAIIASHDTTDVVAVFTHTTPLFCIQSYIQDITLTDAKTCKNCDVLVATVDEDDYTLDEWHSWVDTGVNAYLDT